MPQATDELRQRMNELFGDPISDSGPMEYLQSRGFVSTPSWHWQPRPGVVSYDDLTEDEYACILFLVQEWDQEGLVDG